MFWKLFPSSYEFPKCAVLCCDNGKSPNKFSVETSKNLNVYSARKKLGCLLPSQTVLSHVSCPVE
jgi:hypothetical protein